MRPRALALATIVVFLLTVPMLASMGGAVPPDVTVPSKREIEVNQEINLAEGVDITDADDDPLIIKWDYNSDRDDSGDGVPDNDNQYSGQSPKTKVFHTYNTAGNYTVTVNVSDGTNIVKETFLVHVYDIIGEKEGEYLLDQNSVGKKLTVAREGYISYQVFMNKGEELKIKVDVNEGSGLAVLWVSEENYALLKSGSASGIWWEKKRSKPVQDKISFTKAAPREGNQFIVFYNKDDISGEIGQYIGDDYVLFDMSLKKMEDTSAGGMDGMVIVGVVGVVLAVVIVLVLFMVTRKEHKPLDMTTETDEPEDGIPANVPPEMRPKYKEWLDYEKTYGHKHPEAPYSLVQKEGEVKREVPKYQNYICPECGNTLSYDNFSKIFYCYTCDEKVPNDKALPPEYKAQFEEKPSPEETTSPPTPTPQSGGAPMTAAEGAKPATPPPAPPQGKPKTPPPAPPQEKPKTPPPAPPQGKPKTPPPAPPQGKPKTPPPAPPQEKPKTPPPPKESKESSQ